MATGTANITVLPESGVPGDYNNDSVVDADDYVSWRKGDNPLYNEVATIGFNTPDDYTAWRDRFGNTSANGSGSLDHATIPEPTSLTLLAIAITLATPRRRS